MQIDVLLYDGCDELDVFGPYETLVLAATIHDAGFAVRLTTLEQAACITAAQGARIQPHGTLSARPDMLIVPGGGWSEHAAPGARAEVARNALPRAIADRHAAGSTIASVCTGAMLLAAAGLLEGRPATTHHSALHDLRAMDVRVVDDARVVDDGDIITAGGVTSGIDLALCIVERELGGAAADATARALEYQRAPAIMRTR